MCMYVIHVSRKKHGNMEHGGVQVRFAKLVAFS